MEKAFATDTLIGFQCWNCHKDVQWSVLPGLPKQGGPDGYHGVCCGHQYRAWIKKFTVIVTPPVAQD